MDSHVQIPKCVLKQFKSQDGKVWHLDLAQGNIGLSAAAKLGTEEDYYSKDVEDILCTIVETPLGKLRSIISLEVVKDGDSITLHNTAEKTLKNYIIASIARSKMMLDVFCHRSLTAIATADRENHNDPVRLSLRDGSSMHKLFGTWEMGVLVNESHLGFVVPRNCFYIAGVFKSPHFVAPITPNLSLVLIDSNSRPESKKYIHTITYVNDEDIIKQLNENALHQEYITNKCFIAGIERTELERLKQVLEANRSTYEKEWEELQRI